MAYDNTNSGTIGKNKRKEQPNHPDITGNLNVDGTDYFINGWQKKNGETGETFYSLSVKKKEQQGGGQRGSQSQRQSAPPPPAEQEIPF